MNPDVLRAAQLVNDSVEAIIVYAGPPAAISPCDLPADMKRQFPASLFAGC
jgi:hypothetical protein